MILLSAEWAPAPSLTARNQRPTSDHFATLRRRPFVLRVLEPGAACPVAPEGRETSDEFARAIGPGPVYPVGLSGPHGATMYPWESAVIDDGWYATKVLWVAARGDPPSRLPTPHTSDHHLDARESP